MEYCNSNAKLYEVTITFRSRNPAASQIVICWLCLLYHNSDSIAVMYITIIINVGCCE